MCIKYSYLPKCMAILYLSIYWNVCIVRRVLFNSYVSAQSWFSNVSSHVALMAKQIMQTWCTSICL